MPSARDNMSGITRYPKPGTGLTQAEVQALIDAAIADYAASIPPAEPGGGTGTVTSVGSGAGLTGGPITSAGALALNAASISSLALADTALQPGDIEGGIGVQMGTYLASQVVLPPGTEAVTLADGGYALTGEWYMWCYPSGSIAIDVWCDVFGTIPTVADSITSGTPPAIVGGTFATGTFAGGPISILRTDTLLAHINSNSNVKWMKLLLIGDRT